MMAANPFLASQHNVADHEPLTSGALNIEVNSTGRMPVENSSQASLALADQQNNHAFLESHFKEIEAQVVRRMRD